MERRLTKNKVCKNPECKKRFDQIRFGQVVCSPICGIQYAKQQEQKKVNIRARNKRKDHPSTYLKENKRDLQREVNTIVKLIDKGVHCIDCDKTESWQWDAGHFTSRGSNSTLSYHLDNIFIQGDWCNTRGQVSRERYKEGISKMYGEDYAEHCDGLALKYPVLKLMDHEYPDIIAESRKIVRELKKLDLTYTPTQRKRLRERYNKRLGIYR